MKKILLLFISIITVICVLGSSCSKTGFDQVYIELGISVGNHHVYDSSSANAVWDMMVYDNKLYVGGGDYNTNLGPVNVHYYDIEKKEWKSSGYVQDEEVSNFLVIGGLLTLPGIDPKEDWSLGNYYVLKEDKWDKIRTIPGGIHNFDMVEFDGMLFAGLGVEEGYPIACSKDGGKSFERVMMLKDGESIDTDKCADEHRRVYNLFIQEETLYAQFIYATDVTPISFMINNELYKYEDEKFIYFDDWSLKSPITCRAYPKVNFKNKIYFVNKTPDCSKFIYITDDMKNINKVELPDIDYVYDLIIKNNVLYVLCSQRQENGTHKISVWGNEDGNEAEFKEILYFEYELPAICFEYSEGIFYFGMDSASVYQKKTKSGMVLSVDYEVN